MKKFLFLASLILSMIAINGNAQTTKLRHVLDSLPTTSASIDTVYMTADDIAGRSNYSSVIYADSLAGDTTTGTNGTILLQWALSGSTTQKDTYKDWVTLDSVVLDGIVPQKAFKQGTVEGGPMRLVVSLRHGTQQYRVRWHLGRTNTCL